MPAQMPHCHVSPRSLSSPRPLPRFFRAHTPTLALYLSHACMFSHHYHSLTGPSTAFGLHTSPRRRRCGLWGTVPERQPNELAAAARAIGGARMAATLLQAHDVSDLCIGKPALRWLPPSSTVADAAAELEGAEAIAVWDGEEGSDVAGRVCMADVLLFLCAGANLASPAAALQATLSDLLAAAAPPPVRRIEPDASVLEAVDSLLGGAHSLVVPIRERWRRAGRAELCWLTLEDVVRFFLSSIGLFSPTASRSVSDLGVVRPAANLAVAAGDSALSALPLLSRQPTSPSALCSSDEDNDGKRCVASPCARRGKRGPFSSRAMGWRPAAEAIVCRRGSSLVAVMVQAMAHRATHVWVVDEEGEERELVLVGVVGLLDVLRVLRHHLHQPPPI
ncbi:hypothetical protein SETIT_3G014000v2 [Setaria italica]|uniref:CBS domain-containing protein n=2 Tax=Setaria italica TaxID=4555 RepID=A0A368QAJ2_SETIT|nr:hypothetical protein SETIT_3G014000v2 [Setaria italica]